jgi:hypothetical protein
MDYFWCLENYKASWLLNSWWFLLPDAQTYKECQIRGVSFEVLSDGEEARILDEIPVHLKTWKQ